MCFRIGDGRRSGMPCLSRNAIVISGRLRIKEVAGWISDLPIDIERRTGREDGLKFMVMAKFTAGQDQHFVVPHHQFGN